MGELNVGSGDSTQVYGPPPPPPATDEAKKKEEATAKQAGPATPPAKLPDLKKLTSEVKSLGLKLSPDFLDKNGNIREDKAAEAKKAIAEAAAQRKAKDPGAAARLYQKALSLDPQDKTLRMETAKTWKTWADSQTKPEVKLATLQTALETLKPVGDADQGALFIEYSKEYAGLCIQAKKGNEGRTQLAKAALVASEEQLDGLHAFLAKPENSDLLHENEHPWMFLGDTLASVGKYGEACFAYNRGVNAAQKDKNFPLRDEFNNRWMLAHEEKHPPLLDFVDPLSGEVANPAANGLYQALKAQGVTANSMDKAANGKDADNKISATEVFNYISDHLDDPKVQAVLVQAQITIPEEDKKHVKILGLGIYLADKYTKEADRLKKEDSTQNADAVAKLLTFSASLDPENPKRSEALGDFYSEQKAYPLAMQAYAEARSAAKAMPPPTQNPRAMEGHTEWLAKTETRLKGKIEENFDKGVKVAADSAGEIFTKAKTDGANPQLAMDQLKVLQGVQGMYDLYAQLYPDEMKAPTRLREQGEIYDAIGQALRVSGKTEEAKAFYTKAIEQYQEAINSNKTDAQFCIQTYKMMGAANDELGDYKAALIAYSKASMCEKLRIKYNPKIDGQMPSLTDIKHDRGPTVPQGLWDIPQGNYLRSEVHDINRVDGIDTLPDWASGPRQSYIGKLNARILGGAEHRAELMKGNPPDQAKIFESLNEEAKLLTFFDRGEEAAKIGAEAAELKGKLDNEKLGKEIEVLSKAGLLDQKGLEAVSAKENKDQANPLKFGDYVKFAKGVDGKTQVSFTPAYEALDTPSKNRVMSALVNSAQRNQIAQNVEKAQGPAKLFFEGQLAIFDDNRELAKIKLGEFAKQAQGTQDPKLAQLLMQADGALKILENDGKQKPEDVLRDLRTMLVPLAMTLKPGQDGGIDLGAISTKEVKTFDDFKKYLADQVSVDGVSFNAVLFASYEKVMTNPKHEALLKQLYKQFNSSAQAPEMSVAEMQSALRSFQADIIDVSAGRFVNSHLTNVRGRDQLRTLLQDPTLDKSLKAKLCEEIVEMGEGQGYTPPHIANLFQSKVNSHGFYFQDDKLSLGVRYAMEVLSRGDKKDVAHNAQIDRYTKYPHEVQRLSADQLDHIVTPELVKQMATLAQDLQGKSDGMSMMRSKLATMYLTMVDNDNWSIDKTTDRFKSRVSEKQRAEIANALKHLLSEADGVRNDADFAAWNGRVRRLLRGQGSGTDGDVAAVAKDYLGNYVGDLTAEASEKLNWVVSKTPDDAFSGMEPSVSSSYHELLRFVDEVHVAELNGEPVELIQPRVAASDPAQAEKAQDLIQNLRGMKRGFWYNYQQRNLLSRGMSEKAAWVGAGDIASIKDANKEIDGIIGDLQKATTKEEFEAVKARLTRATKAGGAIHTGFKDSEMDGSEQMINLVQTVAEIVIISYVTQGLGTEAALGRATVTLGQTAARTRNLRLAYQAFSEVRTVANAARAAEVLEAANIARYGSLAGELSTFTAGAGEVAAARNFFNGGARLAQALGGEAGWGAKAVTGFKLGAQISLAENVTASLSGQLRTEPQTLLDWMKDATATGLSMVVSAGLNPTFGKSVEEGVVKGLFQRYAANGAKGALHFLGDTGLEVVEEVVDNYVRKKLDGDYSKLSWDELRDITIVCFAGGAKQGITSHFVNYTKGRIVDSQVKKYNEGFDKRGERVVQDPHHGYVLVDSEGNFLRKTDKLGLQSFLAFDAETNGPAAKGIEVVQFGAAKKGEKGQAFIPGLETFPQTSVDAPNADQAKKTEEAQKKSTEKIQNDRTKKLFVDFLEKGQEVRENKRKDGVVLGLSLVDSKGVKLRDATVDEMEAFQSYQKLTEGFSARGEKVVGSASQGYQLVDSKGQTLRQATAPELTLYLKHKKKTALDSKAATEPLSDAEVNSPAHQKAVDGVLGEMKSELEQGAQVRLKTKAVDKIEVSTANDPKATAHEGTDGKVQYFVKVKVDGSREGASQAEIEKFRSGKVDAPIVLGIEMVDKDGKVIRENLTRNHLEAFEAWKTQAKEAPVHAAMKQSGIKATDEVGKKLQADLLKGVEEGKIGKEDLQKASGEGLSKERVAELEGQLGIPRSEWLAALAKDPAAFKQRIHTIDVTRAKAEDVVSQIQSGKSRAEVKAAVLADLQKSGVEISSHSEKAVDSMIDLTLTAQKNGILNTKGGLTANQLAGLMTTLYLHQSPSVRISGAELTHVPMVVEGTLSLMLTDNPQATVSDKRVAFVTALFHDAGKWDPNMRTESGFTVKQHPFFNPTGMDLEIKSGETLSEGLDRLVKEGTLTQEARDKVKIPGFLVSVIAHHDSSSVHEALLKLEGQGVLKSGEAAKAWQAIERHGLISSWILNNSFGGIGVQSHVFSKPEFGRYVELYQKVTGRMLKGEKVDLGVLTTDNDVKELRGIFKSKFSALDRAMLLGDHQGQIDVAKYMDILSTVYQNPVTDPNVAGGKGEVIVTPESARIGDVFSARDSRIKMTHGVDGVLITHANEQSLVDPSQGVFAEAPFKNAQGWMNGEGLVQAINPKETRDKASGVQKEFRDWAAKNKKNEDSPEAMREWMGTLPLFKQSVGTDGKPVLEKNAQGKPVLDARFVEIREKVEQGFYQWHALNDAKPLEIKQAHEDAQPATAAPAKQTPAQAKAVKEARVAEWRGAFDKGVSIEPVYRNGNILIGYKVLGAKAESAGLFAKDGDGYMATKDQFAAYQKYRVDMKSKEDIKASVIEMGAKMDAQKPANDNDSPEVRMAARAAAVEVLFDPEAPVSKDKLSKNVESVVSVVEALDPVFKQLAPVEKSQFQEQIIKQVQDGSLDVATAKKMADRVAQGENPRDVLMGKVPQSVSAITLVDELSGERTPVESRPPPPPVKGEKLQPKALLEFTSDREVTASTKEALQKWLTQAPDAPQTQAEIEALLVDLRKGAEKQADGKMLVISDGYVHVETIAQLKERMGWAMKTFETLKSEGKVLPDFAKRAILERALKQAGKTEADIDSDVRYVFEQGEKFAGEVKGLPKPIAKNLVERFMRGDINLYSARQSAKKYSSVSEHARALGIQDFDQRMQTRIETWYPDAKTNPSVAMEKSLASFESILNIVEPLLDGMDPANRKNTLDGVVEGKLTLDLAHDKVVEMTLGPVLDKMPPKEAEATVRQFLKTVLGNRYTSATEGTYNNYFKAYGAKKVMADALSAMAFDYKIPTVEFIKLSQSLEGLDTPTQMALLGNLIAQVKRVDGNATTDIDPSSMSAARIGVFSMVSDTTQLAKQLKDLDADGQAKLLQELGEGKYTLPGAIMQADRIGTAAKRGDKSSDPDKTFVSGSQMGPTPPVGLDPDATNPGVPAAKLKAKDEVSDPDATNPGVPAAKLKADPSTKVSSEESQALFKDAEFLAGTDTPFAKAAKDFKEGRITADQYRVAQRAEAQKMIDANKPAFENVMGFLQSLERDPSLHLDKGHPPMGRMKAADDVAPKLVRRGWNSTDPLTDVAGTRIVVGSNTDVEAVIAQLQQKYKIREVYSKDGDMEMEVMTPDQMKAQGVDEQEHNVVWLDSQLDKDGIHRLVEGHPASGYRALHVVVEVDGQPVEIQIKTAAMHEWGEIEHKLVYKNKDLPTAVMGPIKEYRKNVADYLAKVSHGENPGKRPEPPKIPQDTPNRADILANLAKMEGLMDKYTEPSGVKTKASVVDPDATKPGVVHPMPSAALPGNAHVEAASTLADPANSGIRSQLEAAQGDSAKINKVVQPFEAIAKAIEGPHKESAETLRKDISTLKTADPKSKEYQAALTRLHALQTLLRAEGPTELDATKLAKAVEESRIEPSKDFEGALTQRAPVGYPAALGLLAGAVALFSPEMAHAAQDAAVDVSSRGGVGPTEAAVIVGIGLLIAGPTILKKYLKKGPPPAPKVTKQNPIKLESDTKKGLLYPYAKADMKNAEMAMPGKFNQSDSMVIGDRVYLALDTVLPGEKQSRSVLPMSVEDAKRLGVEFDKEGHVSKVPPGEFVYYEGSTKLHGDEMPVAAKGMEIPIAPPTQAVSARDSDGNVSDLRPLSVTESPDGASNAMSYGKAVAVEVGKGENDPVKVTVEIYDPADPEADPKVLGFGFGNPKALEARSFEMSRAEAIQLGILRVDKPGAPPTIAENAVVVLNDEEANLHRNNRVYIPTSNEGGLTFYPAKAMGKSERLVGDIVKVDTDLTSRQGDTVYVWLRVPGDAVAGDKGKLFQPEPIPMSLADARKLGIYLAHDGKLKIRSNEFVATGVTKGNSDQVLVGGKPFSGETEAGVSVMFRIGKDGQIEMEAREKLATPKAELLPPAALAPDGKKIPDALKVAGPLAVGLMAMFPDTAHAATQISDAAASGGWMAAVGAGLSLLVGMAWWNSSGKSVAANHPPLVPTDGVTRFEFYMGKDGRPSIIPGLGMEPAMTFQRGNGGQWFAHEGRSPDNTAQGVQANWKPITDGTLVKLHNPNTGEAYVIPFQAPKEAWVPGYAPPVITDGPAQPAVSGSLPTGKLTTIQPFVDDRPFVIGREQGDLQYNDTTISNPHVTIHRDIESGQYYLVNGKMGDPKKSTNGLLVGGVLMQEKVVPIHNGEYFAFRGADGKLAYFQFNDPKIPAGRVSPAGYVVLGGESFKLKKQGPVNQAMVGSNYFSEVTFGSPIPGDPAGSITLAVSTRRGFDPSRPARTQAIIVTAQQAQQLGLTFGPDGRPLKPVHLQLTPGVEGPAQDQAALANAAPQLAPPTTPPSPKLKVVPTKVDVSFGNQSFALEPHPKNQAIAPGNELGHFTRLTPHVEPGVFVAEIGYGNPGQAQKKMLVNLSIAELKSLGVSFDPQGRPLQPKDWLRVRPGEVQAPVPAQAKPVDMSQVQMVLDDHVKGQPRKGEVEVGPTQYYGTAAGQTHEGIGQKKLGPDPVNEDAVAQGSNWALVLDGMGGMGHGDKASSIPGEAMARYLEQHKNDPDQAKVMADAFQYGYQELWNSPLYEGLRAEARKNGIPEDKIKWPGTVAVAHKVVPDGKGGFNAIIVHVGDAGGVVVDKNGKVKYRTEDQGFAQFLVKQDAAKEGSDPTSPDNEMKKRFHPQGNIVMGGIGGKTAPDPVVKVIPLEPGDRIIMFSDGVGDNMSTTDIIDKTLDAKSPKAAQKAIMDSTLEKLTDLDDTIGELKPGKRLPITLEDGTTAYVAKGGAIYETMTSEKQIDYYKPDNVTVHVYEHNPNNGGKTPSSPPPSGRKLKAVPTPPPLPARGKTQPMAPVPVKVQADGVLREGSPSGILMGGNSITGNGKLIPKDGKVVDFTGIQVRYNPNATQYEFQNPQSSQWQVLQPGQQLHKGNEVYVFGELNGVATDKSVNKTSDLLAQMKSQMATGGVQAHLASLSAQGVRIDNVDRKNMEIFFHPDFEIACFGHDGGNPVRKIGGLLGGSTEVFAMVDPATGTIHRFLSRSPQDGESRKSPLWTAVKNNSGQLIWVNRENPSQQEPVDMSGLPPGAIPVPFRLDRMSGTLNLNVSDLPQSGLSPQAQAKMAHLNGFVAAVPTAGISPMMRYQDQVSSSAAPAVVYSKI